MSNRNLIIYILAIIIIPSSLPFLYFSYVSRNISNDDYKINVLYKNKIEKKSSSEFEKANKFFSRNFSLNLAIQYDSLDECVASAKAYFAQNKVGRFCCEKVNIAEKDWRKRNEIFCIDNSFASFPKL
jgi:hypothetical protein